MTKCHIKIPANNDVILMTIECRLFDVDYSNLGLGKTQSLMFYILHLTTYTLGLRTYPLDLHLPF